MYVYGDHLQQVLRSFQQHQDNMNTKKLADTLRGMAKNKEDMSMSKDHTISIHIHMPQSQSQNTNPMVAMMLKKMMEDKKEDKKDEYQKVDGLTPSVS